MITKLKLYNWKSFADATLYIDQLTFLIGLNASGKSNVLDAFHFAHLLSIGVSLNDAVKQIRGGADWIILRGKNSFSLEFTMEFDDTKYIYTISVEKDGVDFKYLGRTVSYIDAEGHPISHDFNKKYLLIIADLDEIQKKIKEELSNIFILNPIPENMRGYSKLSSKLASDGSNVAGVLAALPEKKKEEVENEITKYVKPLPERDINRIETITVGLSKSDAMLYCYEDWNPTEPVDARGMSDGTLRFIAIVTSLLTVKEGSLVVIEEIDNGLHPSRVKELVTMLKKISSERHVDVICTTHNPVFMNDLGNEMIPFISYVKRGIKGNSTISLLEDKQNLVKLLSYGRTGDLMTEDKL